MKRKGFTLIELLAVIVILGIIALIVGATIGGIIERTRKESYKQSVIGIIQSGENYMAKYLLEHNGFEPTYPLTFRCDGTSCTDGVDTLEFQGAVPKSGAIKINSVKDVHAEYITDGKYCSYGPKESLQVVNDCEDIEMPPQPVALSEKIFSANQLLANPTLSSTSEAANENGFYSMNVTNGFGGENGTTYFFRGNVTNNYVSFANMSWKIIRINEDGTIRIILSEPVSSSGQAFNSSEDYSNYQNAYYSNSELKVFVDDWYDTNLASNIDYSSNVASGNYFCEAAKVRWDGTQSREKLGSASLLEYSSYVPDLSCETDANGRGVINSSVGLLSYDEIVFAGGYPNVTGEHYLNINIGAEWWLMTPAGYEKNRERPMVFVVFGTETNKYIYQRNPYVEFGYIRPVINLKSTVTVTGSGTSADPYVVQ